MKMFSIVGFIAVLTSGVAQADYLCVNTDQSAKVQTYQLSGAEEVGFRVQKAAAVFKLAGAKSIGTGTVEPVNNRVGGWERFTLTDENGAAIVLTTITTWKPGRCNRAGCDPGTQVITGQLKIQDVTHALQCSANNF